MLNKQEGNKSQIADGIHLVMVILLLGFVWTCPMTATETIGFAEAGQVVSNRHHYDGQDTKLACSFLFESGSDQSAAASCLRFHPNAPAESSAWTVFRNFQPINLVSNCFGLSEFWEILWLLAGIREMFWHSDSESDCSRASLLRSWDDFSGQESAVIWNVGLYWSLIQVTFCHANIYHRTAKSLHKHGLARYCFIFSCRLRGTAWKLRKYTNSD